MNLLKKDYWWLWLVLTIFTGGASMIFLAAQLELLEKDAWYMNWKYWLLGTILFIFPVSIMYTVLIIEMTAKVAARLKVSGYELYLSPYIWILCLIIPVIGWAIFFAMYLYILIRIFVKLYKGEGFKTLNCLK